MAMTYASLTAAKTAAGSIKRWFNTEELDVDQVLEEAQALIYQLLRTREMRASATISMGADEYRKAIPADFLDPISLRDTTNLITLRLRTEAWVNDARTYDDGVITSGIPCHYAIFDELFQFDSAYDDSASLALIYFKKPALLAADNPTNFLTSRYPHLLRSACRLEAYDFGGNDGEYQRAEAKLTALIERANAEADLSYRGADFDTER